MKTLSSCQVQNPGLVSSHHQEPGTQKGVLFGRFNSLVNLTASIPHFSKISITIRGLLIEGRVSEALISGILRRLDSSHAAAAWAEFLQEYSGAILLVVRHLEHEPDHVSDCYLFICERLCRDRFRRLRRFRPNGPAQFSTWLSAVVRNLCMDWHRREFGRHRVFRVIGQLSSLDQEVFRQVYERGLLQDDTLLILGPRFRGLSSQQIAESVERIQVRLTPRQRWLLAVRHMKPTGNRGNNEEATPMPDPSDPQPDPEQRAVAEERIEALRRGLDRLPSRERLLLRLCFEQELTLEEVARVLGLQDAQGADRQIKQALEHLRKEIERGGGQTGGKSKSLSVNRD